ncbi:protein sax-3-like, partial [Actinia tenebrosa]|uniref:Protein sax-3-like n=1 Tax=Actinia tenebrosa TaxID=6105 RepID=A0A6P8HT63_ACTTE
MLLDPQSLQQYGTKMVKNWQEGTLVKPEIQHKPTNQIVIQGNTTYFYCNATGVPEPAISWRFSGSSTPKHTGNKLVMHNIRNTGEYEGRYTCIASSRAGKAEESASLTVLVPPSKNDDLPQGVMLQLGQTLGLTCDVYGDPEPSFVWTKRLEGGKKRETLADQKKAELVIQDVRIGDAAYYECTANNSVGNITLNEVFIDVD